MNNKFTIVANPFTLPFEEIMLLISELDECDGFIGGLDMSGRVCVAEDGKLFRGKPLMVVSFNYDTEDFDLSLGSNGWLVFEESRTKIREFLFQIYKVLRIRNLQSEFYRPSFEDYSDNLRVGFIKTIEPTIRKQFVEYDVSKEHGIGSIFSGGGRTQEYLTVLPIPPHISTFDTICHILSLNVGKEHIKYIVTKNNYSYRFTKNYIEGCSAPIIDFLNTEYDCLLLEGSPDDDHMVFLYNQFASCMKIPQLRGIGTCDYKNVRSAMSDRSHNSVWLFVFDFMNYKMDTHILSGSHLYNKMINREENTFKKVRINL